RERAASGAREHRARGARAPSRDLRVAGGGRASPGGPRSGRAGRVADRRGRSLVMPELTPPLHAASCPCRRPVRVHADPAQRGRQRCVAVGTSVPCGGTKMVCATQRSFSAQEASSTQVRWHFKSPVSGVLHPPGGGGPNAAVLSHCSGESGKGCWGPEAERRDGGPWVA